MSKNKNIIFYWEKPDEFFIKKEIQMVNNKQQIPLNMKENDKKIKIKVYLPELKKKEINLNVTNNTLEISIYKNQENFNRENRQERYYNILKETFTLPNKIDPDSACAKFKKGLLFIEMKKSDVENKTKKIEIK